MKRPSFTLIVMVAALLCIAVPTQAVAPYVSYQGILADATGNPLNGSHQLTFNIYGPVGAAGLLWSETHTTQVTNGLFNVTLGSVSPLTLDLLAGDELWLGIQVGSDPEMVPRIRLTSVFWAARAAVADSLAGGGGLGDGHSLDAADGDPVDALYVDNYGRVGIGTTTPTENLVIGGNWGFGYPGNRMIIKDDSADVQSGVMIGEDASDYGFLLWGTAANQFRLGTVNGGVSDYTLNLNAGKVGIGIGTPAEKLHVAGTLQAEGFKLPTGATPGWVLTSDLNGFGTWQPAGGMGGDGDWTITGEGEMYATIAGNVGIGTTDPAAKLDIRDATRPLRAISDGNRAAMEARHTLSSNLAYLGDSGAGVRGVSELLIGVLGESDSVAVVGENSGSLRTMGYLGGDRGAYGESATGNYGYLGGASFAIYGAETTNGNYGGIGYWNYGVLGDTESQVGVMGRANGGTGVAGQATTGWAVYGTHTSTGNYGYIGGRDYALFAESTDDTAIFGLSITGLAGHFQGDVLIQNGDLTTPVLEITGGSDLSEGFEIASTDEGLEPTAGMVVCVDPSRPGELMVSQRAYDTRVAGVISGAGGVRPGLVMGQEGSVASGRSPVALTGRVYCLVDASSGAIEPGDLLTSSDTHGHAMKAADRERSQGAIIGKAMTALESGRGLVLVLVSLQ